MLDRLQVVQHEGSAFVVPAISGLSVRPNAVMFPGSLLKATIAEELDAPGGALEPRCFEWVALTEYPEP